MLMAGSVLTTCPCLSLSPSLYLSPPISGYTPFRRNLNLSRQPLFIFRLLYVNSNESIPFIQLERNLLEEKFRHTLFIIRPFFFLVEGSCRNLSPPRRRFVNSTDLNSTQAPFTGKGREIFSIAIHTHTYIYVKVYVCACVRESRNGGVSRDGRTRLFATRKKKVRRPDSLLL